MRYYNVVSIIQNCVPGVNTKATKKTRIKSSWSPPLEELIKTNIDYSKRHPTRSTVVGYIMRDNPKILVAKGKQIRDYSIIVVECLAIKKQFDSDFKKNL